MYKEMYKEKYKSLLQNHRRANSQIKLQLGEEVLVVRKL